MAQEWDGWSPESVNQYRRFGQGLMNQGVDGSPVGHWTQALGRVLQAGSGAAWSQQANDAEREGKKAVAATVQDGIAKGLPMKQLGASLMGNPWGAEQGQSIALDAMKTGAAQGFQREQQDRQFGQQRQLAELQARLQNSRPTDLVRNLQAAGIDPNSPQGQEIIRNSIKGGSPIDQAVAGMLQGIGRPQGQPGSGMPPQAPQAPQGMPGQPQIMPQSNVAPQGDPNMILAQSGPQAPPGQPTAAPQQQDDPVVETPLGPMPKSKAQSLAFGLAYQGKGDAGKMIMGGVDRLAIGKEGGNDLDKRIIGMTELVARLDGIEQSFKPEFQTIGTRLGLAGAGWLAKINPAKVDPQSRAQLSDFAVFRRRSIENVNRTINELSGAATSVQEAERIRAQGPDAGTGILDGDDPISFQAKMKDQLRSTRLAAARLAWLKKNNPQMLQELAARKFQGVESVMPLDRMGNIMNERRDQLFQELRGKYPNASREQLVPFLTQQLKQEFAI